MTEQILTLRITPFHALSIEAARIDGTDTCIKCLSLSPISFKGSEKTRMPTSDVQSRNSHQNSAGIEKSPTRSG